MDPQKTTADDMDGLHKALTDHFRRALTGPKAADIPVGLVKEIREFLKDNGIQASEETRKAMAADFLGALETFEA